MKVVWVGRNLAYSVGGDHFSSRRFAKHEHCFRRFDDCYLWVFVRDGFIAVDG